MGAERLRGALGLGGVVATAAGLHTVFTGGRSFPPWRPASPMVESELRYYGAFYAGFGAYLLRAASEPEIEPTRVNQAAAVLLLGGLGRAGAWRVRGRPAPLQRALLAVELGLPMLLVAEAARLRR